jgi:hypothetical protein
MKTKAIYYLCLIMLLVPVSASVVYAQSMDELVESFDREYEAMVPPPNSSVNADYKLGQAALGSRYTTKALNLLYQQNQEMVAKYDQVIEKYDKMVEQNEEIIRLLTVIAKSGKGAVVE